MASEYKYKKSLALGSVLLCIALFVLAILLFFKFQTPKLQWGMAQTEADNVFKEQVQVSESNMVSAYESLYKANLRFGNTIFEDAVVTLHFDENAGLYRMDIQFYHDTETVIRGLGKRFGTITESLDQTVTAIEWENEKFGVYYDVAKNNAMIYNPSAYTPL